MNVRSIMLSGLLITSHCMVLTGKHGVYYAELDAYKQSPVAKEMFNEDAHIELIAIQRDVDVFKILTPFQRWVKQTFLECDVIIVGPETLPKLYEYVDSVCKTAEIVTPTIFVTRKDGFLNAAAEKWLLDSGAIIIGQKLIYNLSDRALEAIIAHEIGHIKYNHTNKHLLIRPFTLAITGALFIAFLNKVGGTKIITQEFVDCESGEVTMGYVKKIDWVKCLGGVYLSSFIASLLPAFLIGKKFEKEADEFACKDNGRAEGLIEFCELMLKKEQLREDEFVAITELLQQNKSVLTPNDYYNLIVRYYLAKFGHNIGKAYQYVYHNTFLGAHPSPEARIAAAQQYLQ